MNISIIIPTYNEEAFIASTIQTIKERAGCPDRLQIIVVDGGSEDATATEAERQGALVVHSTCQRRSVQMNEGAQAAAGKVLYFLHADTHPPCDFDRIIRYAVRPGGAGAGCFRLRFDDPHPLLAFYSWCTRFDVNTFRFGDQSLFIDTKLFGRVGGFQSHYRILEGQDIIRRLRKDTSFVICRQHVTTSARKYRQSGPAKLQAIYALMVVLHKIGIAQAKLQNLYDKWVQPF